MARTETSRLRLAILGCGAAAERHSRVLARCAPAVERRYASRDPARAHAFAARWGGRGWFHSYDAAFACDDVDAVLIATPPATHLTLALAALAAGRHVIVEKPAFTDSAAFVAVAAAAARARRQVLVAENYAYKPIVPRLRALWEAGDLGDVRWLLVNAVKRQVARGWRADRALTGGGGLFEGGIHWLAFVCSLGPVEDVVALRAGGSRGTEETCVIGLRYLGGALATLAFSWEVHSPLRGVRVSRIYGTAGSAAFESNGTVLVSGGRRRRVWVPARGDVLGFRAMFRDFLDALATGRPPRYTLAHARHHVALLERARAPDVRQVASEAAASRAAFVSR
jgi:UDP-N-acetylglucosamine 3-dehydrogenase